MVNSLFLWRGQRKTCRRRGGGLIAWPCWSCNQSTVSVESSTGLMAPWGSVDWAPEEMRVQVRCLFDPAREPPPRTPSSAAAGHYFQNHVLTFFSSTQGAQASTQWLRRYLPVLAVLCGCVVWSFGATSGLGLDRNPPEPPPKNREGELCTSMHARGRKQLPLSINTRACPANLKARRSHTRPLATTSEHSTLFRLLLRLLPPGTRGGRLGAKAA